MKFATVLSVAASAIGAVNACTNDVGFTPAFSLLSHSQTEPQPTDPVCVQLYEHCVHYIPKSDSDPYIKCSSQQQCIDACKARTGKCETLYTEGKLAVGCAKLAGNFAEYCVGFETTCTLKSSSSSSSSAE
jgi:hypothetical protein